MFRSYRHLYPLLAFSELCVVNRAYEYLEVHHIRFDNFMNLFCNNSSLSFWVQIFTGL